MNTRKGKEKFKNFNVLLYSECISTIVMGRIVGKLYPDVDAPMQWNTQTGNITTNLKVKIDFTLPVLSARNSVTWNLHVNDSTKGR